MPNLRSVVVKDNNVISINPSAKIKRRMRNFMLPRRVCYNIRKGYRVYVLKIPGKIKISNSKYTN